MKNYFVDLHTHSALSPCADDEMTPNNLAGMAALAGIEVLALTDHNTCANCPAFFAACKRYGVVPVGGMELTTAEEIHLVCLFPTLEAALEYEELVRPRRMQIRNKTEIFGNQFIFDQEDKIIGSDPYFLPAATDIPLEEAPRLVLRCGGVCYPAHIDRPSGGLPAILGDFPPDVPFTAYELNDLANQEEYLRRFPILQKMRCVVSSDAHRLESIRDAAFSLPLQDEPYSSAMIRMSLLGLLAGRP